MHTRIYEERVKERRNTYPTILPISRKYDREMQTSMKMSQASGFLDIHDHHSGKKVLESV
jgi:hypothetical protein